MTLAEGEDCTSRRRMGMGGSSRVDVPKEKEGAWVEVLERVKLTIPGISRGV